MIRVLLADDQSLVRAGFRALLDAQPDIEVAGESADGEAAVRAVRELRPDVVLMDIRMPVLDGLAATRRVTGDPRLGEVKVVMLTRVSRTMVKLGARDRAQLVVSAYESGLVRPGWLG
ncbi:response regulator transcription factor [Streptomyces sp. NPDC090994]|uniref:response regulator transcription factor n=1 Tax=Streptomyces sp. NPDC090994 TaxID=3365969 RepID=UPI0038249930